MDRRRVLEIVEKIAISPIFISFFVFILTTFIVVIFTIIKVETGYDKIFIRDVLVEAHGMLFDILIIGTLIFALHKLAERRLEKRHEIKRYNEEISDFRFWESEEAKFRIAGNIRRLNENDVTKIDLHNCYLENALLVSAQLQDADLRVANLQGAHLARVNLRGANLRIANLHEAWLEFSNLYGADLAHANLEDTDLKNANLQRANLLNAKLHRAKNLKIEQLAKVKTLYYAKLDPMLIEQIKKKYPHLLERPDWVDEEEDEMLREEPI